MGETAKYDAGGGDAFVYFGFYELVEVVAGFEDAGLVLGLGEVVEGDLGRSNWLGSLMVVLKLMRGTKDGLHSHNVVPASDLIFRWPFGHCGRVLVS